MSWKKHTREEVDAVILGTLAGETAIAIGEKFGNDRKWVRQVRDSEVYQTRLAFAKQTLQALLAVTTTEGLPAPILSAGAPVEVVVNDQTQTRKE